MRFRMDLWRAGMRSIPAVPIIFLSILSGCASGPRYDDARSSVPMLRQTESRLVILREWHFSAGGIDARVKINGEKAGTVSNGSVLIVDRTPGMLRISLDSPLDPFDGTEFSIAAEAGQTYYIEIRATHSDYMQTIGGALPYLLGTLRAEGVAQFCGSGWCAQTRSEQEAVPKLGELTLAAPTAPRTR